MTALEFAVEKYAPELEFQQKEENQQELSAQMDDEKWTSVYGSERLAILAAGCGYEFDKDQMQQIARVLVRIHIPKDEVTDDMTFGRQFYLQEKYAVMNAEAAKKEKKGEKPIKDRFRYFLKILEGDTYRPAAYTESTEH